MAQPSGKRVAPSSSSATLRNTVRSVVPVRLGDAERQQIAGAASRFELTLSGFIRQAALQASARIEQKAKVKETEPERPPFVPLDTEPAGHYVDGELVRR